MAIKPLEENCLISDIQQFSEEVVAEIEKQRETIKKLVMDDILSKEKMKELSDEVYKLKISSNIYYAVAALLLLISIL